ncbi:MAG: hypothetical protein V3S46_09965, partial [Nitrospinota bacterium]
MKKPKILYINHNFKGEGTYLRCYNIASELVKKGYEIDIICASDKKFDFAIRTETVKPGLRLITLPRLTGSALYLGYLIRSILALPWVFFKRYDIIHSFAVAIPSTSIPVIVAGKFTRKKILIDWDDAWAGGLAG